MFSGRNSITLCSVPEERHARKEGIDSRHASVGNQSFFVFNEVETPFKPKQSRWASRKENEIVALAQMKIYCVWVSGVASDKNQGFVFL